MQITIFTSIFESRPNMELEIGRSLLQQQKKSGLSEQEGPGGPLPPPTYPPRFRQISWPYLNRGADYAHHIFRPSYGPTAAEWCSYFRLWQGDCQLWSLENSCSTDWLAMLFCVHSPHVFFVYQNLSHSLQIFWNASINMPLARLDFSNQTFFFSFF